MSRSTTCARLLAALALLLPACNDKAADAPKPAVPDAKSVDAKEPTGACDVTVKAGADAPAVTVDAGKTYCVGDQRLTRDTTLDDARKRLRGCRPGDESVGETRLQCEGVVLSFGGPVLVLSAIQPTAGSAPGGGCDVTVNAGADAPAVDVEEGKTYCVGDQRLTRGTTLDDAQKRLSDCRPAEALEGETRLQCKGVRLSFGGPVLVLSRILPTAS